MSEPFDFAAIKARFDALTAVQRASSVVEDLAACIGEIESLQAMSGAEPIPMRLVCPECKQLHIDQGRFAEKPHHTHACQHCGNVWRPAIVPTVGVQFLPGFRDIS